MKSYKHKRIKFSIMILREIWNSIMTGIWSIILISLQSTDVDILPIILLRVTIDVVHV